jgi:hypothetical protein
MRTNRLANPVLARMKRQAAEAMASTARCVSETSKLLEQSCKLLRHDIERAKAGSGRGTEGK